MVVMRLGQKSQTEEKCKKSQRIENGAYREANLDRMEQQISGSGESIPTSARVCDDKHLAGGLGERGQGVRTMCRRTSPWVSLKCRWIYGPSEIAKLHRP